MFGQAYTNFQASPQMYQQPMQTPPQPLAYNYSQHHMSSYQQWQIPSPHYGQYGSYFQSNVFSVQAHQAYNYSQAPPQMYQQPMQTPPQPLAYNYSQQHMSAYQQWQVPSPHYGQYGSYIQSNVFSVQAHQAFQYNSVNDLQQIFFAEMQKNPENTRRSAIQAEDLVNILNNTPSIRNYFRINWNRELCSIMIAMLDRSQDGFMQWEEFLELQQCLVAWHNVFCQHDTDRSGFIESAELMRVMMSFGYKISPQSMETILKRYSRVVAGGRCLIAFDDFVSLCVRMRAFTDAFRRRDSLMNGAETGRAMFEYDDFLRCVMCL